MYVRNNGRIFSPPPGYRGTFFSDDSGEITMKRHSGEISTGEEMVRPPKAVRAKDDDGKLALEALLHSLKGKIGKEELILLTVMLLTAGDGVGIETLLLAILLFTGQGEKAALKTE